MKSAKRSKLIVILLLSLYGSSALAAKDPAISQIQKVLGALCKVSAILNLPSTACDVEKAVAQGVKVSDSIKKTLNAFRSNSLPQALQAALQPILGRDSPQLDSVRQTITETLSTGSIDDLIGGVDDINTQLDGIFTGQADTLQQTLSNASSSTPGASKAANAAASQISGNEATQSLALGALSQQATTAKQIVGTSANGESAQRIAENLSQDTTAADLLSTAQKASEQTAQRAQTAVSSRAALQVVGEQLSFMMEQSASQHLHLVQVLAAQAQSSALTTQQLTTIANLELQKQQSALAGSTEDFKSLVTEAGQYPTYVEETLNGWSKTLIASGSGKTPDLTIP